MEGIETINEISPKERHREREINNKKTPISYTGIVLDKQSKERIEKELGDLIPDDWDIFAHHMTINLGEVKSEHIKYLGFPINLYGTHIGITDMAMAISVEGFESDNQNPHITLAVNTKEGGKPKMSNEIKDWKPLRRKLRLRGYLEEVPFFKK